jgi:hypothetical protein
MLTDAEAAEHLWSGDKSVAKRAAAATAVFALEPQVCAGPPRCSLLLVILPVPHKG